MPGLAYYITLIALTVIMEARGEPGLGREMVAHVIVNRIEHSGLDAETVLYQPGQFAVWADLELRMRFLRCAAEGRLPQDPWCVGIPGGISAEDWWSTYGMALAVYAGKPEPGGLEGMIYFANPDFWPEGLPAWLKGDCRQIGNHRFCRAEIMGAENGK